MEGYTEHEWKVEEIITDDKLNNMEAGIKSAHKNNLTLENAIQEINSFVDAINKTIQSINQTITSLSNDLGLNTTKIVTINNNINSLSNSIGELEETMSTKLTKPNGNGIQGQLIASNGDGTYSYTDKPLEGLPLTGGDITGSIKATEQIYAKFFLASQGDEGHGYSFQGEDDYDTGMFSDGDGDLYFMQDYERTYLEELAKLDSPTFTGQPKAPTPSTGDNSKRIATTAFVKNAIEQLKTELQTN